MMFSWFSGKISAVFRGGKTLLAAAYRRRVFTRQFALFRFFYLFVAVLCVNFYYFN